ncbi:alpha beta-hydrolase [Suillus paluster]|uniref:alpha beta-hydrolase n=1 Tax=Suillus paluster TaxID=48578 RepID=UPI001B870F89|nr:alpha beta-hydrolase [Suillus paluster]KAG1754828.1 alpha beta-hydrolase [Suillus paluster]
MDHYVVAPENVSGSKARADDPIPLVIVEGFLGSAGAAMGSKCAEYLNKGSKNPSRRILFASVGPVSSLHDRACELFYALLGGTVDYGEDHAEAYGHQRYGRVVEVALYPSWSLDNPLHFLGHSMGGPTIVKLQSLMAAGFFGDRGHPDMVLSLTAVSSPFRGTQLVYALGERTDSPPAVRPFSAGDILSKLIHILSYLSPLLPAALDLHAESRRLSYRDASLPSLWQQLCKSDWAQSRDATPYDATFQAAEEREMIGEGQPHQRTFYRSYAASLRHTERDRSYRASIVNIISPLYYSSLVVSSFNFSVLQPTPAIVASVSSSGRRDTDSGCPSSSPGNDSTGCEHFYWENDGVVPVFSQFHPFGCRHGQILNVLHQYRILSDIIRRGYIAIGQYPGIWCVYALENASHFSIAPFWWGSRRQRAFWLELGNWLRAIDDQ